MEAVKAAYVRMHIAVLLFGFTGILGDLISVDGFAVTWWRLLLTIGSFLVWPGMVKKALALPAKVRWKLAGIGVLVALHWATFFGAIAMTNASVTLAMLASIAFFTSILEPLITGSKFKWYELALGCTVIPGVILIKSSTDFPLIGIVTALFSALCSAVFSVLNKVMVARHDAATMTFVELASGWGVMTLLLPLVLLFGDASSFVPHGWDFVYLPILAWLCTTVAYVLSLRALEQLSTFTTNLTINLEPVYTIILAWVILGEDKELHIGFYIGAAVIIGSVFVHPFLAKWLDPKPTPPTSDAFEALD
jgi:drug/metabolite transporter (DMT)-like permease